MTASKKGLGRGLSALIPTKQTSPVIRPEGTERFLKITDIKPNRFQPRRPIREENLRELCDSIKEKGVIEPVIVRRHPQGGYELIAGERRLRASQKLGLASIPAIVRQATDQEALEIALIENIQREDLNPLEEARGYQRLAREFSLSQEQLAQKVGKDRSTVANSLRLLTLPQEVQALIEDGKLSAGHARAVLMAEGAGKQMALAKQIVQKGLSVREAEELARSAKNKTMSGPRERPPKNLDQNLLNIQSELQRALGTRVRIMPQGKSRGRIEIEYYSASDIERIMQKLNIKF